MPLDEAAINSLSLPYVEALYEEFQADPTQVAPEWREFFSAQNGHGTNGSNGHGVVESRRGFFADRALGRQQPRSFEEVPVETNGHAHTPAPVPVASSAPPARRTHVAHAHTPLPKAERIEMAAASRQDHVDRLVRAYRARGHMVAEIDPLGFVRPEPRELDPAHYGISPDDMDHEFSCSTIPGPPTRKLCDILWLLRDTYCRKIGVQFMHIDDLSVRLWLQERMEASRNRVHLTRDEQIRILTRLTDATMFEEFIQNKFVGAKSFSLQGCESLIPLLDLAIDHAGTQQIDEIVLAMAHRGRLNVLANIMGKSPQQIFREFADLDPELHRGRGDVKYHLGHSSEWDTTSGHRVHLSLCFNPSHLAYVGPVAMGRLRAKQDRYGDREHHRGLAILIHGDAAFAGQGVTQEMLNLSQLPGYSVGGTIHVVVNNQIGFTTSPEEGRSCPYATDVARMLQIPVFHVNGEDPEAVAQVVRLAMDFRREFGRDAVIDMYGFRKLGHNEGDEPAFTQPLLYQTIARRHTVRESYLEHLLMLGEVTRAEAEKIAEERKAHLEKELAVARSEDYEHRLPMPSRAWKAFMGGSESAVPDGDTSVPQERLIQLLHLQTRVPQGFHPHDKLLRILKQKAEMARLERPLDWATAEALAFASLATQGIRIRLSGQDCQRGTFSHRHSVWHDVKDGHCHYPLRGLAPGQAPVDIWNSPLCEIGVLGFDYGYSLDSPDALVLWEAQFGDFANAAQVIIDQFIVSAEDKWHRLSGIVMLLPHGYEGQGPEHSSARLERFLDLSAEDNIQVAVPSTPAQYFHLLRRQVLRPWRKPLIVMAPKSLLRHPDCVSPLADLAKGKFVRVLPETSIEDSVAKPDRVLLCAGKIYHELVQHRAACGRAEIPILRMAQLYPFPQLELAAEMARYPVGTRLIWVQEEPENMGAWRFLRMRLGETAFGKYPFSGVTRDPSASPATGSRNSHQLEQQRLLDHAFGELS